MRVLDVVELGLRWAMRMGGVRIRTVPTSVGPICVYDLAGTVGKPTVVLLHGIAANSTTWWPLFFGLRRAAGRIVAIDHLGHGWSHRPDDLDPEALVAAVTEALGQELTEPAVVFGNSLGGALAFQFALQRPDLVKNLLLVSPAGAPWSVAEMDELRTLFEVDTLAKAVSFIHRLHAKPVWYARAIAPGVAARFRAAPMRLLLERLRPEQALTPADMARMPGPSLVLWGQRERVLPHSSVAFFRDHLLGTVETPEDWGHCPQLDRAGPLVRRIRLWLEQSR